MQDEKSEKKAEETASKTMSQVPTEKKKSSKEKKPITLPEVGQVIRRIGVKKYNILDQEQSNSESEEGEKIVYVERKPSKRHKKRIVYRPVEYKKINKYETSSSSSEEEKKHKKKIKSRKRSPDSSDGDIPPAKERYKTREEKKPDYVDYATRIRQNLGLL